MIDLLKKTVDLHKLPPWLLVVAVIVVPIVTTGVTQSLGWFAKSREYDIRMVEIGLSILRGDKGDKEASMPARRWALNLLSEHSEVKINDTDFEDWAENGITPYYGIGESYDYDYGYASDYGDYGYASDYGDYGEAADNAISGSKTKRKKQTNIKKQE